MIIVDASVVIAVLDRHDPHFVAAERLFAAYSAERIGAHRLTIADV